MKKTISILLIMLMLLTMTPFTGITAFAETSGDFEYNVLSDGTASITGYTGSAEDLVIPSELDGYTITCIGDRAFYQCTSLRSITIPDGVTSLGNSAFAGCTSLTNITIPGSVTSIGYQAFFGCTSLASVTILDGVTSIYGDAFFGCTALESITVPDSVTIIGGDAFLDTAYYDNSGHWENDVLYIGHHLIKAKGTISGAYTIKPGTKTIADYAFYRCTALTSVTIPDGVTSIGDTAFRECPSLTSAMIPDSVTRIGSYAFYECSSLTSVTIPDGVPTIGDSTFLDCTSLTNITIPDSVTSIGLSAFAGCTSLTNITIPDSVMRIGSYAFYDCSSSLTSVTIPDSVRSIGNYAFGYYSEEFEEKVDGFIIYSYAGSVAEDYANKNGLHFVPIQDFKDTDSGITISVANPDALAEDTVLSVEKVNVEDGKITYDITLTSNGTAVQPEGKVTVKIPVPDAMDGTKCKVYRQETEGAYTDMNAVYQGGYMVFTTDHFSLYVLTAENSNVLLGDLNGDGKVNASDAVTLARYLAKWDVSKDMEKLGGQETFMVAANINQDEKGAVNSSDAVLLSRYLAKWEVNFSNDIVVPVK